VIRAVEGVEYAGYRHVVRRRRLVDGLVIVLPAARALVVDALFTKYAVERVVGVEGADEDGSIPPQPEDLFVDSPQVGSIGIEGLWRALPGVGCFAGYAVPILGMALRSRFQWVAKDDNNLRFAHQSSHVHRG
jgi:hypothetical protein